VRPDDDTACYAAAEQIQQQRPQWMVLFGCYTRQFVAWPLFPVRQRIIVHAYYPGALLARMDHAEQEYRIRPPQ
jgi:hypothetical protein